MFLFRSTYLVTGEELSRHLVEHLRWLDEGYDRGWFVASGLRDGGVGAVILGQGLQKAEADEFLRLDPFLLNSVAEYEVTEFEAARTVAELAAFS